VHDPAGRGPKRHRALGVDPAFDRVAVKFDVLLLDRSAAPSATRICSRIRSMSVIISVTGCSTWMRVFISMK
jgi:hypothetical protein